MIHFWLRTIPQNNKFESYELQLESGMFTTYQFFVDVQMSLKNLKTVKEVSPMK